MWGKSEALNTFRMQSLGRHLASFQTAWMQAGNLTKGSATKNTSFPFTHIEIVRHVHMDIHSLVQSDITDLGYCPFCQSKLF